MCPRKKSKKAVGYMSLDLFCHVVNQLSGRNVVQLSLHLTGEPLLHPQIAEMVRYAKHKGLEHVRFATNATLLDETLARNLIESGLDSLTVSMDASVAERYCPGEKRKRLLKDLDQNVLRLIELRTHKGLKCPEVQMQIINMESTKGLIDSFRKKWEGIADLVTVKELLSWSGHIKVTRNKTSRRLICFHHLTQGVVQWDGDVSFCCLYIDDQGNSEGIIGNAVHTSLEDIFLGERRREIIEAQLRGNYDHVPHCRECLDWNDLLDCVHG